MRFQRTPVRPRSAPVILTILCLVVAQQRSGATPSLSFGFTLGGSQWDAIRAVTTDASGNIYAVGETYSNNFPGAKPSDHSRASGDAFVVKLDPTGTQIIYSAILGGSSYDSARAVASDASGNVYITGITQSSDFPVTSGAIQSASGSPGTEDAFVAEVDPLGTIVYATYLGGGGSDEAYGIALDQVGSIYIAGSTTSSNFPSTQSAAQTSFGGSTDCFVAKLNPGGASLAYMTYIGGQGVDLCKGITVDLSGEAIVTGVTNSNNFPTTAAALGPALSGSYDAFVTKIGSIGDRFLFSTYLGGESIDEGNAIALDPTGVIYVAGDTTSVGFPITQGALQARNNGGYDGFLCVIAGDGSRILEATYLGGGAADSIGSVFVAQDGRIVVAGYTASTDFPTVVPIQSTYGGGPFDGFAAILESTGSNLDFSTFIGGGGDDRAYAIAPLGANQIVIGGQMLSVSVPYVQQRFLSAPAGQYDGFLAVVSTSSTLNSQPLRFVPVTPCRVADTRDAAGPFGGPAIAGASSRSFSIPNSSCAIPAVAQAYSLNVTVVPHGPLGFLTIWPAGTSLPLVSTLNSLDGRVRANAAIVPAGVGGAVAVYVSGTADVVLDVNGYFVPATDPTAQAFYPLTPCRVADTRGAPGPLSGPSLIGGSSRTFPILLAGNCGIPATAQAYALNFTAVPKGPLGFLTTWPTGQAQPLASTLNATTGTVTANAAFLPAGSGGSIDVFATGDSDLVIDIDGYFAPPSATGLSLYNMTPCRVLDTRQPPGSQPLNGGVVVQVPVLASNCAVPVTAEAFVFNATVVPPGSVGFLSLWPAGQPEPLVSTLNAVDGSITANLAVVPTLNGSISVFPSNPTHLLLDIFGYFGP